MIRLRVHRRFARAYHATMPVLFVAIFVAELLGVHL